MTVNLKNRYIVKFLKYLKILDGKLHMKLSKKKKLILKNLTKLFQRAG